MQVIGLAWYNHRYLDVIGLAWYSSRYLEMIGLACHNHHYVLPGGDRASMLQPPLPGGDRASMVQQPLPEGDRASMAQPQPPEVVEQSTQGDRSQGLDHHGLPTGDRVVGSNRSPLHEGHGRWNTATYHKQIRSGQRDIKVGIDYQTPDFKAGIGCQKQDCKVGTVVLTGQKLLSSKAVTNSRPVEDRVAVNRESRLR